MNTGIAHQIGTEGDEYTPLTVPPLYRDDILQEAELLKLEGKTPSLRLLRKRAEAYEALLFADYLPSGATEIIWEGPQLPDFEVVEAIVNWAMEQAEATREKVLTFLEDPTEEGLKTLLPQIQLQAPQKIKGGSLAQAILRLLSTRPHTKQELYEYARSEHQAKRPEATIRQLVRRLTREGKIQEVSHDTYSATH